MKTRKTVIAVLMAILLISAALMGCMNSLEGTDNDAENNYQVPVGKGVISFKNVTLDTRTVLPDPDLSNRLFDVDILSTTPANSTANDKKLVKVGYSTLIGAGANASIALNPDTYTISVVAYNSASQPVASWSESAFTIGAGGTKNFVITLTAYGVVGSTTGTFAFNITPSSTTGATTTFDIRTYPGDSTIGSSYPSYTTDGGTTGDIHVFPETLSATTGPDSITLTSGYYIVKITSALAGYQTVEEIHALHIYQNMVSTLPTLTMSALVVNTFSVTYNLNGGSDTNSNYNNTSPWSTESVKYGNYAKGLGSPPVNPVGSVDTFSGWYTDSGTTTGNEWVLASNRVFSNQTLYAKWTSPSTPGTGTFNITFVIDDEFDNFTVNSGSTTISRSALFGSTAGASTVSLTINPPAGGGNWTSVSWSINGTPIGSPHLATTVDPNDTLIINNSATFWEFLVGSSFNVNVTVSKGGAPYTPSTPITITVGM